MSGGQPEPLYLVVGKVLRPHGIRGELRMEILTDYPERLVPGRRVYLGEEHRPFTIEAVRRHQGLLLLKLKQCNDRTMAESFYHALVYVRLTDAVPLEEGEYYHFQLIGMRVETESGEVLGEITEVLDAQGANDVYVVQGPRGEILIPGIRDVVRVLDVAARRMVIAPMPGLLGEE